MIHSQALKALAASPLASAAVSTFKATHARAPVKYLTYIKYPAYMWCAGIWMRPEAGALHEFSRAPSRLVSLLPDHPFALSTHRSLRRGNDSPNDWAPLLDELEDATSSRLRDEAGAIHLVRDEDRRYGPGWTPMMADFCHFPPTGSRFTDGLLVDLRNSTAAGALLAPDDWSASQVFGRKTWDSQADGIVYPSVRDPACECAAVLRPPVLSATWQGRHLGYEWDGKRISHVFELNLLS